MSSCNWEYSSSTPTIYELSAWSFQLQRQHSWTISLGSCIKTIQWWITQVVHHQDQGKYPLAFALLMVTSGMTNKPLCEVLIVKVPGWFTHNKLLRSQSVKTGWPEWWHDIYWPILTYCSHIRKNECVINGCVGM